MPGNSIFSIKKDNNSVTFSIYGAGIGIGSFFAYLAVGILAGLLMSGATDTPAAFIAAMIIALNINCFFMLLRSKPQHLSATKEKVGNIDRKDINRLYIENKLISNEPFSSFSKEHRPPMSPLWLAFGPMAAATYVSANIAHITSAFGGQMREMNLKSRAKREFSIVAETTAGKKKYLFKNLKEDEGFSLFEAVSRAVFLSFDDVPETDTTLGTRGKFKRKLFQIILTVSLIPWLIVPYALLFDNSQGMSFDEYLGNIIKIDGTDGAYGFPVSTGKYFLSKDELDFSHSFKLPHKTGTTSFSREENRYSSIFFVKDGYEPKNVVIKYIKGKPQKLSVTLNKLKENSGMGYLLIQGMDSIRAGAYFVKSSNKCDFYS